MARKLAGAVVVVLLLAVLLLSSSADASTQVDCSFHKTKNPSCAIGYRDDGTCAKQCTSEGYGGWMCAPDCTCITCPSVDLEYRLKTYKIQKQGNRGAPAAGGGAF